LDINDKIKVGDIPQQQKRSSDSKYYQAKLMEIGKYSRISTVLG
jgi:hypothetical protein